MINPRQLELFTAVYEEGSMTAAARKLHMSQPAVSQAVKDIEDRYDTGLFERRGSKLYITEAGRTLYGFSKRILNLYSDMDEAIRLNEGVREIRVGANISAGTAHLTKLITRFNEKYPDIAVKAMVFQGPVLLRALHHNELDIALIEDQKNSPEMSDIITEPYYKDRIAVIASTDHPCAGKKVELSQLADETFLFREKSAGVRKLFDGILTAKGLSVNIGWECTSSEALADAVKLKMGIAVLPYLLIKDQLDAGKIAEIRIKDADLSRNLNIAYHRDKILTDPLLYFIDRVRNI